MTTTPTPELPPLPKPAKVETGGHQEMSFGPDGIKIIADHTTKTAYFTDSQMQAYARAAIAAHTRPTEARSLTTPREGWLWMTHPDRNDGEPIPVKLVHENGEWWYIPFDEDAIEFSWADRDEDWTIVPAAGWNNPFAQARAISPKALPEAIKPEGALKVATDLLREVVGPLEVSAAIIEDEDGGETSDALIKRIKRFVEQYDRALLADSKGAPEARKPLTAAQIEFGLNNQMEDPSGDEASGFYAGVNFAEMHHGIRAGG